MQKRQAFLLWILGKFSSSFSKENYFSVFICNVGLQLQIVNNKDATLWITEWQGVESS